MGRRRISKWQTWNCLIDVLRLPKQGITFPSQVGLPLSGQTGAQYVMMETHYNNEQRRKGIRQSIITSDILLSHYFQTTWTALEYDYITLQPNGDTTAQC